MPATPTEQLTSRTARHIAVRERPLQLGPERELVAILAAPESTASDPESPVVLLLNAGVIHRIGPHRLHVNLARALAAHGVTSIRLDLSGIGDSRGVPGALSFRQSAVADTRATMDWLGSEIGARRFILFGLCSGADNALATAAVDERVVGLALLDPPAYVTRQARVRSALSKLLPRRPSDIAALGAGVIRRLRERVGRESASQADAPQYVGVREVPPPAEYGEQLAALVARGVAILAVFSGVLGERYNHPDQLFELFPELQGKVERAYFPTANHSFTEIEAQAALMSTVCAWIERRR